MSRILTRESISWSKGCICNPEISSEKISANIEQGRYRIHRAMSVEVYSKLYPGKLKFVSEKQLSYSKFTYTRGIGPIILVPDWLRRRRG